jgi:hypothetical protein
MFSKPLPEFSCKLNALATALTCQWLMGPCKVNDVELDDGTVRQQQQRQQQQQCCLTAAAAPGVVLMCWC